MGWGGLPEHLVASDLASGKLALMHMEGFEIRISQLFVVRRSDRPVCAVAEEL